MPNGMMGRPGMPGMPFPGQPGGMNVNMGQQPGMGGNPPGMPGMQGMTPVGNPQMGSMSPGMMHPGTPGMNPQMAVAQVSIVITPSWSRKTRMSMLTLKFPFSFAFPNSFTSPSTPAINNPTLDPVSAMMLSMSNVADAVPSINAQLAQEQYSPWGPQ